MTIIRNNSSILRNGSNCRYGSYGSYGSDDIGYPEPHTRLFTVARRLAQQKRQRWHLWRLVWVVKNSRQTAHKTEKFMLSVVYR